MIQLKKHIENTYDIKINEIRLLRDMIGYLYYIRCDDNEYAFKLYRKKTSIDYKSVLNIMRHLLNEGVCVPSILDTKDENLFTTIDDQVGVLFEYINGKEVEDAQDEQVIKAYTKMQDAMKNYVVKSPIRRRSFYIDRYLEILESLSYDQHKIEELRIIGYDLFDHVMKLDEGFCHGDFHSGNMVLKDSEVYVFDFDACNQLSPQIDLVVYFDQTHFNTFNNHDIEKTIDVLKSIKEIDDKDIFNMLSFIPIRHYEIIATIIEAKGSEDINVSFYDQQYHWIKDFYTSWKALDLK